MRDRVGKLCQFWEEFGTGMALEVSVGANHALNVVPAKAGTHNPSEWFGED